MGGIPSGLSSHRFRENIHVKAKVAKKLKTKGIYIPQDFDYSYAQFKRYYISSLSKKKKMMITAFYEGMKKELGENDIKLSDSWDEFVMSLFIEKKIKKGRSDFDEQTLKRMQTLLISKDIGDFREKVYLPSMQGKIKNQIYTEDDFQNLPTVMKKGDDALKLLYVPPFALALSMIALVLNLVTVMVMISMLFPAYYKKVKFYIKPVLFVLLFLVPFIFNVKMDTPLIEESIQNNASMERYLNFLSWLQFYENINDTFND